MKSAPPPAAGNTRTTTPPKNLQTTALFIDITQNENRSCGGNSPGGTHSVMLPAGHHFFLFSSVLTCPRYPTQLSGEPLIFTDRKEQSFYFQLRI